MVRLSNQVCTSRMRARQRARAIVEKSRAMMRDRAPTSSRTPHRIDLSRVALVDESTNRPTLPRRDHRTTPRSRRRAGASLKHGECDDLPGMRSEKT